MKEKKLKDPGTESRNTTKNGILKIAKENITKNIGSE